MYEICSSFVVSPAADWRSTCMALQRRLGLLSERRAGPDFAHYLAGRFSAIATDPCGCAWLKARSGRRAWPRPVPSDLAFRSVTTGKEYLWHEEAKLNTAANRNEKPNTSRRAMRNVALRRRKRNPAPGR